VLDTPIIIAVFVLTYIGMAAGRLPWLQVDRTGIALLGVIALLATRTRTLDEIAARVDMPTLVLLFALMIISAQFVTSGFFEQAAHRITRLGGTPVRTLALTVATAGAISAVLANDIVIFALTPLVAAAVRERGLDPRPYLIAMACACNAGSAATIIGAPQTILIGELGDLRLSTYVLACGMPALVALVLVFGVIALVWRNRLALPEGGFTPETPLAPPIGEAHPHDRNQTNKGLIALAALLALFSTDLPRDVGGLLIAALLLANRKFTSRTMIAAVDWPLLLLFACLFGVTGALGTTPLMGLLTNALDQANLLPESLVVMAPLTLLMSNTIGNVPSVILLLQIWQTPSPGALYGLALLSSLAGNLLLVGSLSNIIMVEQAERLGITIKFADFARTGIPITVLSMAFGILWLIVTGFMPWWPHP